MGNMSELIGHRNQRYDRHQAPRTNPEVSGQEPNKIQIRNQKTIYSSRAFSISNFRIFIYLELGTCFLKFDS